MIVIHIQLITRWDRQIKKKRYSHYLERKTKRMVYNTCKNTYQNSKRLVIYQCMVEALTDEQKFSLCGKICQDILAGASDGILDINGASGVLSDGLQI